MSQFSTTPIKVGYSRYEFGKIFQIYSQNVYAGLFKDFSFSEIEGHFYLSFREEAGKTPLITVQKRKLGPDKSLFVATMSNNLGQPIEIVRSEKIDLFAERLRDKISELRDARLSSKSLRVVS